MSKQIALRYNALLGHQLDYIVIDGSGSMRDKWWDFMASADAYIDILRAGNLNAHLIATVFDDDSIGYPQRDEPLSDFKSFHQNPLRMGGGYTPLYDAIHLCALDLKELNPERCSIVFVTDGDENNSKFTTLAQAGAFIAWMKAKGWQVTFIGCDFNNEAQAKALGVNEHNMIGVAKANLVDAAKALGHKRVRYGRTGEDMHFSDEEKQQFGGYLAPPKK